MTHQEQYTKLTGITVPLNTPHMPWHLMAVMSLIIKDRFKMAASWEATLLRFSMKSVHIHTTSHQQQNPLHPSCLLSLASFKEIKVSILYMDGKELHFFSLTLCMAKRTSVMKISERNVSRTYAIVLCLPVRCFLENVFKV